ncbi:NADH-quinone oxidoreductase subunit M [Paenibacillus sp. UMB4589-SE434]|uniref:complex I subunit 4 family protein n=1 Tax=Paenibacillus sp. UMB4589-SE434 TaxID=3046314 RepID=UPI002551BCEB|nr:NADH-quinone oxidoreductase subunit M [Paenibacillus sp. UMB4589-SE434]MDK8181593.1 NADH-quinone oxidoreductase subunit M [Paenibacillus sp. UMB4589-SE434]
MAAQISSIPWLSLLTFSPLLGVFVLLLIPKERVLAIRIMGIVTTFISLIIAVAIYAGYDALKQGNTLLEKFDWISIPLNLDVAKGIQSWTFDIQYHLALDGLSLPLVVMTTIVAALSALASVSVRKRQKTYYILLLLLEVGMLGVFMARDLLLFFAFFEWTLVPTFFLIGIWGLANRERAANHFLLYNGLGSALMLVAFAILVATAGFDQITDSSGIVKYVYSSDLHTIVNHLQSSEAAANLGHNPFFLSEGWRIGTFVLLLIAFGIKLPIFPFHTWMLKVHAEAPTPVVMLHSGVLLKMGAYGLIQFGIVLLPHQLADWATVLAILGIINILYGAILAFVQTEFRLVLAYSSISHMGFVLFGIAAMNEIGLQGAIMQMVSHGFISALFFLLVGSVIERTGTTRLDELGGLAKRLPFISALLLIAGLASLGLPGLSGFPAELFSLLGLYGKLPWAATLGAFGVILSAVYVLRGVLSITFGPIAAHHHELKDARLVEAVPAIVLTACIVLIGLFPSLVTAPVEYGVSQIIDMFKVGG